MTVSTRTATAPLPPAAPAADTADPGLEARLAARLADMTVRLEVAAVAHEVRTAHLSTDPVDLADVITTPYAPVTAPAAMPPPTYRTPVAALLERAQHRMETAGWCTGALTDAFGAVCLMGAIRIEARGDAGLAADAEEVLLDAIRREFGDDVPSVPWFNDRQRNGRVPARMLGRAAGLADTRIL
ncbi:hypothetical protein [Streptomyces sp. NPDC101237]|uniref:DUF6197 family protein n=1 Tax=Streptomyces sp. NPDC101237 TaxID=3366139 RepID=UPI00380E2988